MTPRVSFTFWFGVFLALSVASIAIAVAITRPSSEEDWTVVALVYASPAAAWSAPPELQLGDVQARTITVRLQPRVLPADVLVAISDAAACAPLDDVDGTIAEIVPSPISANAVSGSLIGRVRAFAIAARARDSSFRCGYGTRPPARPSRDGVLPSRPTRASSTSTSTTGA